MARIRQIAREEANLRSDIQDIHWPLDATLILVGLLLAGVVTQQGNFTDPRWLQNAWTWLAAIVLGVAACLFVSRWISRCWVRRSMQFAMLFSLSAHLLFLLAAADMWVPAKPWAPTKDRDVEVVVQERPRTRRPDYFRHQLGQTGAEPDFLRPVETAPPSPTDEDFQRPELTDWTLPELQVEVELEPQPITSPSSLRRPERSEATPRQTDDARRMSRQTGAREIPLDIESATLDSPTIPEPPATPPPLAAVGAETAKAGSAPIVNPAAPPEDASAEQAMLAERLAATAAAPELASRIPPSREDMVAPSDSVRVPTPQRRDMSQLREAPPVTEVDRLALASPSRTDENESAAAAAAERLRPNQATLARQRMARSTLSPPIPTAPQDDLSASNSPRPRARSTTRHPPTLPAPPLDVAERPVERPQLSSQRSLPSPIVDSVARVQLPSGENQSPARQEELAPDRLSEPSNSASRLDSARLARSDRRAELTAPRTTDGPVVDEQLATLDGSAMRRRAESFSRRGTAQAPIEVTAEPGPGGLAVRDGREAGMEDRRLSEDRLVVESLAARFPRRDVGSPPPLVYAPVVAAEAFRQRIDRVTGAAGGEQLSPRTERAIELGLAYLARHQAEDGRWTLLGDGDERPIMRADSAATALALLAFQGAGYTHQRDRYAEVVRPGLRFLLSTQQPDGCLFMEADTNSNMYARLYSHGIAALALCEAYGMTQDPELERPAQLAVDFIIRSQHRELGGWRYVPNIGSDTSVTGWMMMALKSGELSGLTVPRESYEGVRRWLDRSQASSEAPHLYRYNPLAPDTEAQRHGRQSSATMTAVGLLLRLYVGWNRQHAGMRRGADYLLANLPALGAPDEPEEARQRDTYYWYYATQVMFHMGGEDWRTWQERLHPLLIGSQEQEGEVAGSWDPLEPVPDRWASHAGRLYVTTMNLLSLEIAYRHLPLYIDAGK